MISARTPLFFLGLEALVLAILGWHGSMHITQRQAEEAAIDAVTRLMPGADLSLAGAARHLRFPSLEEPGAAFADAPGSPDLDPAGAAMAPPIEVYTAIETRSPSRPALRPLGQATPR